MVSTILVVEDEQDLLETLDYNLRLEGYETRLAPTGQRALELASQSPPPDLILLDLMLPDLSGVEVCRTLRGQRTTRDVPIVMVTARGEEIDRVVGFEVGADDYIVKPYSMRELMVRVRAILRRLQQSETVAECVTFGRLSVDVAAHRCAVDDEEVPLTALEFKLLTTLLDRRGRVQTREMLLSDVWRLSADLTTRTVDTHIKRLRHKLNAAGSYIETLRGVGYRFRAEPVRG